MKNSSHTYGGCRSNDENSLRSIQLIQNIEQRTNITSSNDPYVIPLLTCVNVVGPFQVMFFCWCCCCECVEFLLLMLLLLILWRRLPSLLGSFAHTFRTTFASGPNVQLSETLTDAHITWSVASCCCFHCLSSAAPDGCREQSHHNVVPSEYRGCR